MKQKDIALIVVVVVISAIASLVVSNTIFASPAKRQQQVDVVQSLNASFPTPDSRYFNSSSIDPTQFTQIGNTTNPNPFNGTATQP
jgi:hypothetical protein